MSQQMLEALVLYLAEDGIRHISPAAGETLLVPWDPELQPVESVADEVAGLGLSPFMVHSTSWRVCDGRILLTFVVLVDNPSSIPAGHRDVRIARTELARGGPLSPPVDVKLDQVVEHGLRHLAWLIGDDEGIREHLPAWAGALAVYRPEPFRTFSDRGTREGE